MADGTFDLGADLVELAPYVPDAPAVPLREVAFRADGWSADEIETLRTMFLADEGMQAIATAVGHSFHGTRTKVCQLGLRRNSARPFSEIEDAEIVRRYGDDATAAIAQDLGRSCSSIYQRAGILGLTEGRPPPWTPWEDAQLAAGYESGVPVLQLAALIGRPVSGVLSRAHDHLRVKHLNAPETWSQVEIARAIALAGEGLTNKRIHATMRAEGFPERTLLGLKLMMTRLVEGRGWGRMWTAEEDTLLRQAYAAGDSLTPLAHRIGRTRGSIRWRVGFLGIQGTHEKKAGWLVDPAWTAAEDALLREVYGKVRGKKLKALFPNRRGQAVYQRANSIGLEGGYSRPVVEDELRAIQIAYLVGIGFTDLAQATGRDAATIHRLAKVMGLHFSDPSRPRVPKTPRAKRPAPPNLAEILAMAPRDMPPGPFLPLLGGWRKRGRPSTKENHLVA
jgi:hypothetical protein